MQKTRDDARLLSFNDSWSDDSMNQFFTQCPRSSAASAVSSSRSSSAARRPPNLPSVLALVAGEDVLTTAGPSVTTATLAPADDDDAPAIALRAMKRRLLAPSMNSLMPSAIA